MSSRARVTLLATAVPVAMTLIALLALSATLVQADPGLTIQKYAPDVVMAGNELIYHISVSNDGTADTNTYVTDTLPAEVMYIADTGGCTEDGGVLTCFLDQLDAGAYRDFEVKVYVAPDAVAGEADGTIEIANTASVSSTEEYAETSEWTFVEDSADLAVVKMSHSGDEVLAGEPFVYTIFVENLGPSFARGVAIRDEIVVEPGMTLSVAAAPENPGGDNCVVNPADWGYTIECYKGTPLDVKDAEYAGRWSVEVTLEADETQTVSDLVNVFTTEEGGTPDPNLSNNTAEDFVYVEDVADLSIAKELDWCDEGGPYDECIAGGNASFSITVDNIGPSTAENVVVEDLLPAGVTVVEVNGVSGCTTGIPGNPLAPLTCNLGSIPSGEGASFNVEVQIDPNYVDPELPFQSRPLENDAWVYSDIFDSDNSDNRAHVILDVYTSSVVWMWKTGPNFATAGEEMSYHIRVRNLGPSTLRTFHFLDPLPPEVGYLGYEFEQGTGTCIYPWPMTGDHAAHCYLDDLAPGGVTIVHLRVFVNPDVANGISIWNYIERWFADSYVDDLFGPLDWETEVLAPADLSITKTSEPMQVYPGEQKVYHIEVTNNGPAQAADVIVTDTLPLSVTYEIDNDDCGLLTQDPDVLECHLGTIPAGQSIGFDISALVDEGASPGEITNTALVSMPYDTNINNNTAWATNLVLEPIVADVSMAKYWGTDPENPITALTAGASYTLTLHVHNNGPITANNVVVEDPLPAGLTVLGVNYSETGGSCTVGVPGDPSNPLVWNVGNLPAGQGSRLFVIIRIDPFYTGTLTNDAWVESDTPDPNDGNNRVHVIVSVEAPPEADLSIHKTSEPPKVVPGEQKVYHIEVTNNGPADAPNVVVSDTLPIELRYEIDTDNCAVTPGPPDLLTCNLGTIPSGETKRFDIHALVDPPYPVTEKKQITNLAEVWMETDVVTDTNPGNNSDWTKNLILVPNAADLELQKTPNTYSPYAGTSMSFNLLVINHGPLPAENVVVEDMLPEGLTVLGVSPSQGSCTTGAPGLEPLRCNLGTLVRDAPATVFVNVRIDPYYMGELENDAVVSSDIYDPDNGNNRDFVIVNVSAYSSVFLKKGCGFEEEVLAGEEIQYDILVRNNGPSTVHNFELWDLLPDDVTYLSYEILPGGGQCFYTPHLPPMHGGDGGPGLHCYLGDVAPTDTRIVYITVRINPDAPAGELTNRVTDWDAESNVSLPGPPSNRWCSNDVITEADLSIRKTADPYKVFAGDQVRYDVSVTNNGPGTANDVVVLDTLDPNVEYEIDTDSCEVVYSEAVTATMFGSTQPMAGGALFSTDLVSGTGSYIGEMPDYLAPEIEYDNLDGRLFASMGFQPWFWSWYYGDPYDPPRLYELDPATGDSLGYVELDELCALPGLEFVGDTLYGTCSTYPPDYFGGEPELVTIDPDSGHVSYVGDTDVDDALIHGLAYEESSMTMYGLVVGYGPNVLATIDLDDGEATPQCVISDTLYGYPDYSLRAIEFGPDGTLYGGIATASDLVEIDPTAYYADGEWWCDMTHIGDTGFPVTGLTLRNEMPASVGLECSLDDIPPGETSTFSIWVRVKPDAAGLINNQVRVSSETADPNGGNNRDSEANLVQGRADLKVQKFGKPEGEVRAGDKLTYTVIVDNLGTGYAHNVTLDDVMRSDGSFDLL